MRPSAQESPDNTLHSRHERRKQRTRRSLLDAARLVIARQGYEDTGVLDITEEADVSKGTFYLHFKDKEDLTHALIVEGFEELSERIDAVMSGERSREAVAEALREVFRYAAEKRDLFRIMLGRHASAELNLFAFNYYAGVVEEILVSSGMTDDALPYPPALLAQFIAGAGVRIGLWWMEDDHGLSPDQLSDIMLHLLSDGVPTLMPPPSNLKE